LFAILVFEVAELRFVHVSIFFAVEHTLVVTGLACAGKLFICAAFATIYVHAGELYPTPVRYVGDT